MSQAMILDLRIIGNALFETEFVTVSRHPCSHSVKRKARNSRPRSRERVPIAYGRREAPAMLRPLHRRRSGAFMSGAESPVQRAPGELTLPRFGIRIWLRYRASRLMVPAFRRTGHPFAVEDSESPYRRLSLCSLPVPKQVCREPRESPPSPGRLTAGPGSLRIE
jgi:hypothetical protein